MAVQAYDEEKVSFSDVSQSVQNAFVLSICVSKYDGSGNDLPDVKVDQNIVNSLFSDVYNYDVTNNLGTEYVSFSELNGYLRRAQHKLRRNDEGYDAFILVLSGHGNKGTFYTSDLAQVSIESIQERFYGDNLPNFVNLPKIFVVDACRGNKNIRPVETKSLSLTESYHTGQQFTVLYGNVLGFTTIATKNGSILIQSLDKVLRQVASSIDKPNDNNNLNEISMGMRFYVLAMSDAKMIVDQHETRTTRTRLFAKKGKSSRATVDLRNVIKYKNMEYTAQQYTVTVHNESGSDTTIGIFALNSSIGSVSSSLVFASLGMPNHGRNIAKWKSDWSVTYGVIDNDIFSRRGAIIDVDPSSQTHNNGAFMSYNEQVKVWDLVPKQLDLLNGIIGIETNSKYSNAEAEQQHMNVCAMVDRQHVFANQGKPNDLYRFSINVTYYLSTMAVGYGSVVNNTASSNATAIKFDRENSDVAYTLDANRRFVLNDNQ